MSCFGPKKSCGGRTAVRVTSSTRGPAQTLENEIGGNPGLVLNVLDQNRFTAGPCCKRYFNSMSLPASRVLLIEDDVKLPEVLATLLQSDHITIESAVNGTEAIALARQQPFDLILLDLGLPDANGFDLQIGR